MPVQIKASPKLRDAAPRKDQAQSGKPKFVLQDRVQAPPSKGGGATRILKVAFVLLLLGLGAQAILSKIQGPDPHYLTAKKLVTDYEFGKPKQVRNYEHAAYHQALAELDLVDPDSESAGPAEAMRIELERKITAFREQQRKINERLSSARVRSKKKKAAEAQARLHSLLVPKTEMPECELEEGDDLYGGHKH
jgi:hypothetical protein